MLIFYKKLLDVSKIFLQKNAAKDRKRAKYGDRSLKKAFR